MRLIIALGEQTRYSIRRLSVDIGIFRGTWFLEPVNVLPSSFIDKRKHIRRESDHGAVFEMESMIPFVWISSE